MLFWKLYFLKRQTRKVVSRVWRGKLGIITVNIYGSVEHQPQGKNSEMGFREPGRRGEEKHFSRPPGKPGATWLGYASSTDGISVKWLLFCPFFTSILKTNIYAPFLLNIFPQCDSFSFIFRYDYSLSILNRKLRPAADLAQRRLVMCVCVSVCLYVCISVCVQTSVSVCVYLCVCKHTGKVSHWKLHSNFLYNIKVVYIPMFSWGSTGKN